jgi:hypothetical protein
VLQHGTPYYICTPPENSQLGGGASGLTNKTRLLPWSGAVFPLFQMFAPPFTISKSVRLKSQRSLSSGEDLQHVTLEQQAHGPGQQGRSPPREAFFRMANFMDRLDVLGPRSEASKEREVFPAHCACCRTLLCLQASK